MANDIVKARRIYFCSGSLECPIGLLSNEALMGLWSVAASAKMARQKEAIANVWQADQKEGRRLS